MRNIMMISIHKSVFFYITNKYYTLVKTVH